MGIDYDGGMIVGLHCHDIPTISLPVDCEDYGDYFLEFCEDRDVDRMCPYFNADMDDCIFGFRIKDTNLDRWDEFTKEVNEKAEKFTKLFGIKPKLIGTQNIW